MKKRPGFFSRIKKGLSKTRNNFIGKVNNAISPGKKLDDDLIEELEEIFIMADMGVSTTTRLLDELKKDVKKEGLKNNDEIKTYIKKKIESILSIEKENSDILSNCPHVILVIGVNGSGKTTTIGKMAKIFKKEGKKVLLAAGDTFRAAAIEQLEIWNSRIGSYIVKHKNGADPAAVVFDAINAAKARKSDVLIIDTAGRLHTKTNLMEGLKKINRVIKKEIPGAPHEVLLVLDSTLGQNIVSQAKEFNEAIGVSGFVLTKLDGSAKGGVIINIVDTLKIPIRFLGIGEGIDDLMKFNPELFVKALFEDNNDKQLE